MDNDVLAPLHATAHEGSAEIPAHRFQSRFSTVKSYLYQLFKPIKSLNRAGTIVLLLSTVVLVQLASQTGVFHEEATHQETDVKHSTCGHQTTDCGHVGITEGECLQKSCCWRPASTPNTPWCFQPAAAVCQWTVITSDYIDARTLLLSLTLDKTCNYTNSSIITMKIQQSCHQIRIKTLNNDPADRIMPDYPPEECAVPTLTFSFTKSPFTFKVTRKDTVIFQSSSIQLSPDFVEVSTIVPLDANIYGVGEVSRDAFRRDPNHTRQALWNRDAASPVDENLYGTHPMYVEIRNTEAHGVFFRNSHGGDFLLSPGLATWRFLSMPFDLFVFAGPRPMDVVSQYWKVIGYPALPPIWALGYHHSRYGFKSLAEMESVVESHDQHELPLDCIWADIDYMDQFNDFTFDEVNFPLKRFQQFQKNLAEKQQHLVLILDPGIKNETGHHPFDLGMQMDVFIKEPHTDHPIVGAVWPGTTVFPDWTHPNVTKYWGHFIGELLDVLPVSGIWIDMNEPASFCESNCDGDGRLDRPKYKINNGGSEMPLSFKTIPPSARQYAASHAALHNLYGFTEAKVTHDVLIARSKKRPFILSRSTFSGSGVFASHWLGDNWSSQESYIRSISGILNFQLFGIPFTGSDVCGFINNTTERLCARWMALAAWQPLMRNHNAFGSEDQAAYRWPLVLSASKRHLQERYRLIPLWYTSLWRASVGQSANVLSSLAFEWPGEETSKIDRQYLIDGKLLISPCPWIDSENYDAYFPPDETWFDYWTLALLSHGGWRSMHASYHDVPVHVRGGSIIPRYSDYNGETVLQLHSRASYDILVVFDTNGFAQGDLVLDDGVTTNAPSTHVIFNATKSGLTSTVTRQSSAHLQRIIITGYSHMLSIGPTLKICNERKHQEKILTLCPTMHTDFSMPISFTWQLE
jgi:alpha-glucosidase (family GH31 glycosyl hydrolase)